ncbi:MAG: nucleoside monophosphate kinase, partial [Caedimonadaceae bacterium]
RITCSECGKIYNLLAIKPKTSGECDTCKALLVQRPCDNLESFHKRIFLFNKTVKILMDYYEEKGHLMKISSDMSLEDFRTQVIDLDKALG